MSSQDSISLYELLGEVQSAIKIGLPANYWVRAEILSVKHANYWRLELASYEDNENEAKTSGIIWPSDEAIVQRFEKYTGASFAVGLKILIKCSVNFHPEYGFSLTIKDIDPKFSLGDVEANLNMIRERLRNKGEYSLNRDLATPKDFRRVAVIAPNKAAGLGDFQSQANVLESYNLCSFDYHNALFQGSNSENSIIEAMVAINNRNKQSRYDAVVIIRGGGDKAGLYQMNNLKIARGVCRLPIPVLIGIGHQQDSTILDELANLSFPTPSLVASHITKTICANAMNAKSKNKTLNSHAKKILSSAKNDSKKLHGNLTLLARQQLLVSNRNIGGFHQKLNDQPSKVLSSAKREIDGTFSVTIHNGKLSVNRQKQTAAQILETLWTTANHVAKDAKSLSIKHHQNLTSSTRIALANISKDIQQVRSTLNASSVLSSARRKTDITYTSLTHKSRLTISQQKLALEQINGFVFKSAQQIIKDATGKSQKHHRELVSEARIVASKASGKTQLVYKDLKASSVSRLNRLTHHLGLFNTGLSSSAKRLLVIAKNEVARNNDRVEFLNPKKIIDRGFVLIKSLDDRIITESSKLSTNDRVVLQMKDGQKIASIED